MSKIIEQVKNTLEKVLERGQPFSCVLGTVTRHRSQLVGKDKTVKQFFTLAYPSDSSTNEDGSPRIFSTDIEHWGAEPALNDGDQVIAMGYNTVNKWIAKQDSANGKVKAGQEMKKMYVSTHHGILVVKRADNTEKKEF